MKKDRANKKMLLMAKMLFLFSGSTLSADPLVAQTEMQKSDTSKKSPLVLNLSVPKLKNCLGEKSVELKVKIVNTGNKPITIDKSALWLSYSIAQSNKGVAGGLWLRLNYGFDEKYGDYVLLAPNQKYSEPHEFSFIKEDNIRDDFFSRTGRYDVEMDYKISKLDNISPEVANTIFTDKITSNKTSFYLKKKCRPN